jgi:hypothetical protein
LRKLHSEELHNFTKYNCNDEVKKDETGRAYSTHGERIAWELQRRETTRKIEKCVGGKY